MNTMPHAKYFIECKGCEKNICRVCRDECPECGEKIPVDPKDRDLIVQMRKSINAPYPGH